MKNLKVLKSPLEIRGIGKGDAYYIYRSPPTLHPDLHPIFILHPIRYPPPHIMDTYRHILSHCCAVYNKYSINIKMNSRHIDLILGNVTEKENYNRTENIEIETIIDR